MEVLYKSRRARQALRARFVPAQSRFVTFTAFLWGNRPVDARVRGEGVFAIKPVRTFVSAIVAIVAPVAAVAQTTVTLNATSGSSVIANGYSTSGGLTLNMGFLMDVLAVGGGGGGGARFGGGGGAGGVLHQTNVVLGGTAAPSQTIGVVVGSGGTGGVVSGGGGTGGAGSGGNGGNSVFGNLTGFGGGGGGRGDAANGAAGGSGGGGAGRFASSDGHWHGRPRK